MDLQSKQWRSWFKDWMESLVGGLKIGMPMTWVFIASLSPIFTLLGVGAALTSGTVSNALTWSAAGVFSVIFVVAFVQAPYRGQKAKTQQEHKLLEQEHASHEKTNDLLKPFLELQEEQRLHPAGYVKIYPIDMGFSKVRHSDVPRPIVQFKVENYLLGAIEFVDPDAIECEVTNDERTGVLNTQPLTILTRYRSHLSRLCSNEVWMSYQISNETRQHLIANNSLRQGWKYVPKWKFRIVETGEVFPVEIIERRYGGVVEMGG